MNIIIYLVVILVILYFLLRWWSNISPKKMSKGVRLVTILLLALLAVLFAILCIGGSFGGGNMFQANQAYAQLSGQFPMLAGNGPMFGFLLAILVGAVIIGGIKSIALSLIHI